MRNDINKILRTHPDVILAVLACFFSAVIVGYLSWGTGIAVNDINEALQNVVSGQKAGFNLQATAGLDWRGLVK